MSMAVLRLTILMACCFVLQAGLPYFMFGSPADGTLLNLYMALGIASCFIGMIIHRLRVGDTQLAFEEAVMQGVVRTQNVGLWRSRMLGVLFIAQRILCWPAFEIGVHQLRIWQSGMKIKGSIDAAAAVSLFPFELSISLFLAIASLVTTGLALSSGHPSVYAIAFLWLLIGSTALKHVAILLGPLDVQQRLRRALDPVFVSYFILTASDLVCLLLSYNGVLNWTTGNLLSPSSLNSVYNQLEAFKDIMNFWQKLPSSAFGYLIGLSGLLWLLTLGNSVLKLFTNYQRSTDDYLAIAGCCARVGLDGRARAMLAKTDPTTRQQFEQKALILASLGEFGAATPFIDEYLRQLMIGRTPISPDYKYFEFWGSISSMQNVNDLIRGLMVFGDEHEMSDVLLSTVCLDARQVGIDPSSLAQFMETNTLAEHFPLAFITLKWLVDQEREVLVIFDALPVPDHAALRAAKRCCAALLIPARRKSPEVTEGMVKSWIETELPEILSETRDAVPLHRFMLSAQLQRIQRYFSQFQISAESIASAILSLEASVDDDPLVAKLRSAVGPPAVKSSPQSVTSPGMMQPAALSP